jgi:dTDP-4-dehydrorhamnose reductase
MHRVLVLGGDGMLGQMVKRVLSRSEQLAVSGTCPGQEGALFHFNVEDGLSGLQRIIEHHGPFDYLINCIGILSSQIREQDSQSLRRAIRINALFPHDLAALAQEIGARVIQISTDGVFARDAGVCLEDTPCDCDDAYGQTKHLGEVNAPGSLNLRCSIIGPNPLSKQGLLEWLMAQPRAAEVQGYTDHWWNGVTTRQFSELCHTLIVQELFEAVREESPVHHFCPNQPVSKYELLQLCRAVFRPDLTVKPVTSPGGPVCRILSTRYDSLRKLYAYGRSMRSAVEELAAEI